MKVINVPIIILICFIIIGSILFITKTKQVSSTKSTTESLLVTNLHKDIPKTIPSIIKTESLSLLPATLKHGDTIGLVASASPPYNQNDIAYAKRQLELLGFKVILGKNLKIINQNWFKLHINSAKDRASDLMDMFKNPKVKAIVEVRGGLGSKKVLKLLDYKWLKQHPKILIGFSDTTAITLAIYAKTGLITFSGPMGMMTWTNFTKKYFNKVLMHDSSGIVFNEYEPIFDHNGNIENPQHIIHGGIATGTLIGGNLSAIGDLINSPYTLNYNHAILFIEDVNDYQLRKLDKTLYKLKNNGILNKLSGFVFASCAKCNLDNRGYNNLVKILNKYIKPLGIPAFSGSMIGHFDSIYTIPIGVKAQINANHFNLTLLQSATQNTP